MSTSERVLTALPVIGVVGAVIAGIWWTNQDVRREPVAETPGVVQEAWKRPDRANPCYRLVGATPAERVDRCLAATGVPILGKEMQGNLDSLAKQGKTLVIGKGTVTTETVPFTPALRDLLLGSDEAAAAKALKDQGVRTVLVTRDLAGALDRDALVLSRLAQHDFLEWFNLRDVTADTLLYTVRDSPARMPLSTGTDLLTSLRARLAGGPTPPMGWQPESVQLIGTMRLQGQTLVTRYAAVTEKDGRGKATLDAALAELAAAMRREWARTVETRGLGALETRLPELRVEIHVVTERANIEPRSRYQIFDLWEVGIDGVIFKAADGATDQRFSYLPGSEAVVRNLHTADDFLQYASKEGGWRDRRPWEDTSTQLDLVRTQHFMERDPGGGTGAVRLFRGMPEVPMEHVTDQNVQSMLISGGEWWVNNQFADGSFEYKYWPDQNRQSEDYNEVRHLLGVRDLADAWRYRNDDRYLAAARRGMDFMLRYKVDDTDPVGGDTFQYKGETVKMQHPPPGTMLFRYPKPGEGGDPVNQKLGTVAVAVLGWVAYADATGSHEFDAQIRKMGKFTLAMLEETGRFAPYYVPENHPYAKERNDIVPGEAALALGKIAEYFDEPEWVASYPKFVDFYKPWFEERANRKVEGGRWPVETYTNQDRLDLVQFGPWSVMAAAQYYDITKDARAAEFGLQVADWMIDNYQWTTERSPWPDYVGGYYKMPEELPAMQTFCYSEGTAAAYRLANLYAPERAAKYEKSTREAIRFLEVMQYDDLDAYAFAKGEKIRGGIKYEMAQPKIRIDYVGHGLSTLSQFLDNRRDDPNATFVVADPKDVTRDWDHPSTPEELALQLHGTPLPVPRTGARPVQEAAVAPTLQAPSHQGTDDEE